MKNDSLDGIPTDFIQSLVDEVASVAEMEPYPAEMLAVEKLLDNELYREESIHRSECWNALRGDSSIEDVDLDELFLQCRDNPSLKQFQNRPKTRVRTEYISIKSKFPSGYARVIVEPPTETRVVYESGGKLEYEKLYKFSIMLPAKAGSEKQESNLVELMKTVEGVFAHELFHLLYRRRKNEFRPITQNSEHRKEIEEKAADEFAKLLIAKRSKKEPINSLFRT